MKYGYQRPSLWQRAWSLIQHLFFIGLILGVFVLFMDKVFMPIYVRKGQVQELPDTRGMNLEDAVMMLETKGFIVFESEPEYTPTLPPGVVFDQVPAPLTKVKIGRRVYLSPTLEEQLLRVPDLFGLSVRNARLEIERQGFELDTIYYDYSRYPEGAVIEQAPGKSSKAKRGSPVWIKISLGSQPDRFRVPLLVEKSLPTARELLARSGLMEGSILYRLDENLIPYTVLGQSVKAGTILTERIVVDLIVSVTDVSEVPEPDPENEEEEN